MCVNKWVVFCCIEGGKNLVSVQNLNAHWLFRDPSQNIFPADENLKRQMRLCIFSLVMICFVTFFKCHHFIHHDKN